MRDHSSDASLSSRWAVGLLLVAAAVAVGPLWSPRLGLLFGDLVGYFPSLYGGSAWDPFVQGGSPRLPNPQAGWFYPPAWLLVGDLQRGLSLFLALHFFVGGVATWAWVRTRFGDSWEALLAGLVFALSGPTWSLAVTPDKLPGHALLPVLFLGIHLLFGNRRGLGLALGVVAIAGTWLAGSIEHLIIAGLAAPLWAAFLPGAGEGRLRRAGLTVGVLLLGSLAASVVLVPFLTLLPETVRSGALPMDVALQRSTHPLDWLGWVAPNPFWEGAEIRYLVADGVSRGRWLRSLYGGAVVVSLFAALCVPAAGLVRGEATKGVAGTKMFIFSRVRIMAVPGGKLIPVPPKKPDAPIPGILLAALGALGFAFLALGDLNPLRSLIHALPGLGSVRYPDKWWLGTVLFQAWLVAAAVRAARTEKRAAQAAAAVCLLLLILAGLGLALPYEGGSLQRTVVRLADAAPALALGLAVLVSWSRGKAGFAWVLVLAVGGDLAAASLRSMPVEPVPVTRPAAIEAIAADRARQPPQPDVPPRLWDHSVHTGPLPLPPPGVSIGEQQRTLVAPNTGAEHGLAYLDGMRATRLARQAQFTGPLEDIPVEPRRRLLATLGADYWVVWDLDEARELVGAGLRPVAAAPGTTLPVPVLADARLPRVRQVFRWVVVDDDAAAWRHIADRDTPTVGAVIRGDPGTEALVGAPVGGSLRAPPLRFHNPSAGRWEVAWMGPRPSLLVLQEAWAPGWEFSVDGGAWTPAARVEHMLIGVPLPAGEGTVVVRYRAAGLGLGAALSLLGLGILGLGVRRLRAE